MFISQQDAQNIVDEMKGTIGKDINIMDETGHILASTNSARRGQLHQGAVQVIREGLPSLTIWQDEPRLGVQAGINLPILIDGVLAGVIGITGAPDQVSAFGSVIKRLTEIMIERVRQNEQAGLLDRAKSLFVENWLFSESPDWAELEVRGRLLGFDLSASYTVAVLLLPHPVSGGQSRMENLWEMQSSLTLRMVQDRIQEDSRHNCAVIRDKILILLCDMDRAAAFSKVSRICQDVEGYYAIQVSAGISSASRSPADLRRCYLEAKTASSVAAQSSKSLVLFYDKVTLEFIVQSIPKDIKQDLRRLVFSTCSPQERREFIQVIQLYFQQNGDLKRCAETLFIHRNTFQYRIDSLKRKTGYDLRIPKDAVLLYLAAQELP